MTHSIFIPIYDTKCHILLWPKDPVAELIKVGLSDSQAREMIADTCQAITWTNDASEGIVLLNKRVEGAVLWGTIAHELFHAVHSMLQERGLKLRDGDANEAHAYLLGWLLEEAFKTIALDKGAQGG